MTDWAEYTRIKCIQEGLIPKPKKPMRTLDNGLTKNQKKALRRNRK